MPYAAKPKLFDPNDPNQQNPNISGGAGASFDTGVPGQDAGASKDKKSSGQYTNIQSYLDANKDQGDQMGQKIASDVSAKADDATNQINRLSAKAPTVAAYDPNEIYGKIDTLSKNQRQEQKMSVGEPTQTPTYDFNTPQAPKPQTGLTDQEKNAYRTQRQTGGYAGPATVDQVEGYADTMKATNEASAKAKMAGNEYGQQQLLKETYARPQYSAGENRLDQALVQGSSQSRAALQNVNQKYAPLEQMFSTASNQLGNNINQANQQSLANKNAVLQAEEKQWQDLINPIQSRADQMSRDNPLLIDRVNADVANQDNKINEETLKLLGLSEGTDIYDLDLNNYINRDITPVGLNQAASAEERSKYQMLADLMQDQSRTQITADGKTVNPVSFNKSQFDQDLSGKTKEYETAYTQGSTEGVLSAKYLAPPPGYSEAGMQTLLREVLRRSPNPRDIEEKGIPYLQSVIDADPDEASAVVAAKAIEGIKKSMVDWRKNYGVGRKIEREA